MTGESECATGSPSRAKTRVLPLITEALRGQAGDDPVDQFPKFGQRYAIVVQLAAERVGYLGRGAGPPGELAEEVDPVGAAKLGNPNSMVTGHDENEISRAHQLPGEQTGPVGREIDPLFDPDEVRALGGRRAIPRAGTR